MSSLVRKTTGRGKTLGARSETDISRDIQKAMRAMGHLVVRVHSGSFRAGSHWIEAAEKGTPDMVVLTTGGVTCWLEVKTAKGGLSDDQKRWHERAQRMGHRVAVVRSVRDALEVVR